MLFTFLALTRAEDIPDCANISTMYMHCPFGEGGEQSVIDCPESGYYEIQCNLLANIKCNGTAIKRISCYPTNGKDPATALCLSVILGFLGADRFYLGYPTIGLFKLFTGGFFGLGWYIDIFLIALRIAKPARGGVYAFKPGANFRVRLPGKLFN